MEQPSKKLKTELLEEEAILWALSDPNKRSTFESDVVDFESCNEVLGNFLPANKMFVRECYKPLFQEVWRLLNRFPGVAVLGSPGIGKSLFGILIVIEVIRGLRQGKSPQLARGALKWPVVYANDEGHYIFSEDGKVSKRSGGFLIGNAGLAILQGNPVYNPSSCRYCVWISSPFPRGPRKAIEKQGFHKLYMWPWTADELVDCWKKGCAPANLFDKEETEEEEQEQGGGAAENAEEEEKGGESRKGLHWEMVEGVLSDIGDEKCSPDQIHEIVLRHWAAEMGPIPGRVFFPLQGALTMKEALACESDYSRLLLGYQGIIDAAGKPELPFANVLFMIVPDSTGLAFEFAPVSLAATRRVLRKTLALESNN